MEKYEGLEMQVITFEVDDVLAVAMDRSGYVVGQDPTQRQQ